MPEHVVTLLLGDGDERRVDLEPSSFTVLCMMSPIF